jgi:hypothetical protein
MADRGEADRTPDWRVWREMRAPQLWQCVALSLNINPFKVGTNDDSWYGTPLIFYESQEFQDRLDTACAIFGRDGVPANPRRPVSLHSFAALVRRLGWVAPPELLAMADEQKTSTTAEGKRTDLEEAVSRFHPEAEASPQGGEEAANDPIAKRKAPDLFVNALIRLLVEIDKRAAEKGMPFDVNEMPGTKADFRALAVTFNGELFKAQSAFNDYLAGLVRFKQGAQETAFYRDLFPKLFLVIV